MPREEGEKKTLFPSKEERYACWNARDSYWGCLDSNGACDSLRKIFEANCPSTWVKHFDRRKKYLEFQEKMKDGFDPIEDDNKS